MPVNVLFAALYERWETYETPLKSALAAAGVEANLGYGFLRPRMWTTSSMPPTASVQDFTPFTRTKAVLNLWAGVEDVVGNETLKMPLARMVDHGLTQGMVEWVTGHVLRHHLNTDLHVHGQDGEWRRYVPPLAGRPPGDGAGPRRARHGLRHGAGRSGF